MTEKPGFNVHLPDLQTLDKIKEANIPWIRCDFNWYILEPEPGVFDFSRTDSIVNFCKENGISVFPMIGYTPGWANGNRGINHLPDDLSRWTNFVSRVANHYKNDIQVWGIWNEPNLPEFFQGSMQDYVDKIFIPASQVIKNLDSRLKVATPEIATLVSGDWWKWLDRFAGLAGHYDVLALHCYAKDGRTTINYIEKGRWPRWINWLSGLLNLFYPGNQAIKNKLKNIEREKWLTETGWKSNAVGEESQRLYYEDMVNYLENSSVFQKVFFYEIIDDPNFDQKWGVLRSDYSEKPAYQYIKSLGR